MRICLKPYCRKDCSSCEPVDHVLLRNLAKVAVTTKMCGLHVSLHSVPLPFVMRMKRLGVITNAKYKYAKA